MNISTQNRVQYSSNRSHPEYRQLQLQLQLSLHISRG